MGARHNQRMGAWGEARAARWYEAEGYAVVARNWRGAGGELDLVLCREGTFVFCEVKTRSSAAFGMPEEAVDVDKQHRIRRLATAFLRETGHRPRRMRFDVAAVLAGEVTVFPDAF